MDMSDEELLGFAQSIAHGFTPTMAAEECNLDLTATQASVLASSDRLRKLIHKITEEGMMDLSLEHIRVAHQLSIDRDFAYRLGNPAAAINATVQRAKVLGVFVERFDTNNKVAIASPTQLTPEEWTERFGAMAENRDG